MASTDDDYVEESSHDTWGFINRVKKQVLSSLKDGILEDGMLVAVEEFSSLPQHQQQAILDRLGSYTFDSKDTGRPELTIQMNGTTADRMNFQVSVKPA